MRQLMRSYVIALIVKELVNVEIVRKVAMTES